MKRLAAMRRRTMLGTVRDRLRLRSETHRVLDANPGPSNRRLRAAKLRIRGRLGDHVSWSRRMNWM